MSKKVYSKEEIQKIAKSLIGKTFKELNNNKLDKSNYSKGTYGHILEEDVFKYGANSNSDPDFFEAGIELKVTPYKKNKNGFFSAKERLVLGIINYMEEYKHDFYNSHFWYKNKLLQIVWYLYDELKNKDDMIITHELLFDFPNEDINIIIKDWQYIISKIKDGKAEELSEADTMYLGACTKGKDSSSVREQPFSEYQAKQRAYCLKTSYMTQLVRLYIAKEKNSKIFNNEQYVSVKKFEDILIDKISQYYGKTEKELADMFNIHSNAKNVFELYVSAMLGITGKISNTDEFLKANILPKTIRIEENGKIVESMSFPAFKFDEIIKESWDDSTLRNLFSQTKFMFIIFKAHRNQYCFEKIVFWNMPIKILDAEIKNVWQKTIEIIKTGEIVREIKNGKKYTNFPGMSANGICHVRPHARNKGDVYSLPYPDKLTGQKKYTKQCFWLNNGFIEKIIK